MPFASCFSSAFPGTSALPWGVSICMGRRKSPLTLTWASAGAFIEKVTVPSALTTGDFTCVPLHKASCPCAAMMVVIMAMVKSVFFMIWVVAMNNMGKIKKKIINRGVSS